MKKKDSFVSLSAYKTVDTKILQNRVLGRAWAKQSPSSVETYKKVGHLNYNNILLHLKDYKSGDPLELTNTGTFNFSRYAEKKVLIEIAKFLKLQFSTLSGYITSGGTESNIYAMWLARNWAKEHCSPNGKIHWIIPEVSHYSFQKALNLLDIFDNAKHEVYSIEKNAQKITKEKDIKNILFSLSQKKNSEPIILVLTALTTEYGLMDPIESILKFIQQKNIQNIYVHIDACYSGFILPYLEKYKDTFSYPEISSLSLDFHKTFGGPIGSGAIFVNNSFYKYAEVYSPYLSGNSDYTLSGSRSGVSAIQIYELWQEKNKLLKKEFIKSTKLTEFLFEKLGEIKEIKVLYKPFTNYLIFSTSLQKEKEYEKFITICNSYSVSYSLDKNTHYYKMIIDHSLEKKTLLQFSKEIQQCIKEITTK